MSQKCKHITPEQWFCKECSKYKAVAFFTDRAFFNNDGERKIKPSYYYSSLSQDKKGEDFYIRKITKLMNSNSHRGKWEGVYFYDNQTGVELDKLMP